MAAEVVATCKDGILMTICCYATQQLVHQGPPSESEQGVGKKRWWQWERVGRRGGGVSFVAIVSVNMGKGVAKLGSNPRKKIIISLII